MPSISIFCLLCVSLDLHGDARLCSCYPSGSVIVFTEVEGDRVPFRHLVKHNKHLPVSRKSFLSLFSLFVNINSKQNRLKVK